MHIAIVLIYWTKDILQNQKVCVLLHLEIINNFIYYEQLRNCFHFNSRSI